MPFGSHISIQGGTPNAPERAAAIGADCFQVFTRNQRTWQVASVSDEEAQAFRSARAETGLGPVMSHNSYLINLASPEPDKHQRSLDAMHAELERCHRLGIELLNFHPGAHCGAGLETGLDNIAAALNDLTRAHPDKTDVTLVLETVAGQGTTIGADFSELAALLARLEAPERFAVCLDTAHSFAAGYDLTSEAGWQATWAAFDHHLGMESLAAFHCNDSKAPFASRKDRHALLGRGHIGPEAFQRLVTDPRTREVPLYLETPAGPAGWAEEIAWLRRLAAGEWPAPPAIAETKSSL